MACTNKTGHRGVHLGTSASEQGAHNGTLASTEHGLEVVQTTGLLPALLVQPAAATSHCVLQ